MNRVKLVIIKLNEWTGRGVSFLLVAMMVTVCFEVGSRYFFNRPTIWSFDVSTYLLCVYSLLGGGFALLRGGHVKVDIIYIRFSPRTRALLDCLTSLLFFVFMVVLLWEGWKMMHLSLLHKETSGTILDWPLFPTKLMVPVGAFLLLIQGMLKFINDLMIALTGRSSEIPVEGGPFSRN